MMETQTGNKNQADFRGRHMHNSLNACAILGCKICVKISPLFYLRHTTLSLNDYSCDRVLDSTECNMCLAHLFKERYLSSVRMLASLSFSFLVWMAPLQRHVYKLFSLKWGRVRDQELTVLFLWLRAIRTGLHHFVDEGHSICAILQMKKKRHQKISDRMFLLLSFEIIIQWHYSSPHKNVSWCCWWGY